MVTGGGIRGENRWFLSLGVELLPYWDDWRKAMYVYANVSPWSILLLNISTHQIHFFCSASIHRFSQHCSLLPACGVFMTTIINSLLHFAGHIVNACHKSYALTFTSAAKPWVPGDQTLLLTFSCHANFCSAGSSCSYKSATCYPKINFFSPSPFFGIFPQLILVWLKDT